MTTTTTTETIKIRTITESTWKEILTAMDAAEAAVPEAHNRVRASRRGEVLVEELDKPDAGHQGHYALRREVR